ALVGGATFAPDGKVGQAFSFDGVDDYVQIGAKTNLVATTVITLEAWIFPTGPGSHATEGGVILSKEGEYEIGRFADGTIRSAFANTNPGWAWINTGFVAPQNAWTHVAVVYDNGVIRTYANGALVHTFAGSGNIGDIDNTRNDFRIGGRQ